MSPNGGNAESAFYKFNNMLIAPVIRTDCPECYTSSSDCSGKIGTRLHAFN